MKWSNKKILREYLMHLIERRECSCMWCWVKFYKALNEWFLKSLRKLFKNKFLSVKANKILWFHLSHFKIILLFINICFLFKFSRNIIFEPSLFFQASLVLPRIFTCLMTHSKHLLLKLCFLQNIFELISLSLSFYAGKTSFDSLLLTALTHAPTI